ncbi:MAG TPA: AMP-binding protein [Bryobacteraceae bacterium]|nr:AMP-binding protein [Bryobacteraceae bacterium]
MLSHAYGPVVPLLDLTIPARLEQIAASFPDHEALILPHQNLRLTWRELLRQSEEVAAGVLALGLAPGDRVGIWSSNCLEWVLLEYACARARLVLVNVNPAYRAHELRYILARSRMRAIFLHDAEPRANYRAILAEAIADAELPLQHTIWLGQESWQQLPEGAGPLPPIPTDPHEIVNIQYTSGTTGTPKGALLTHHNLLNNAAVLAEWLRLTEQDRYVAPFPLYHCAGCVLSVLTSLHTGTTLILPSPGFDAAAVLRAVHTERGTVLGGVPTMMIAVLEHPAFAEHNVTSLRSAIIGGAPCPTELMKRMIRDLTVNEVAVIYGQTEASPLITVTHPDDPPHLRVTTVGRACNNTEVKIVSPSTGETLPAGEQGELCARGYFVMKGYDGEPEATARAIDPDGWLHTGDLAVMLDSGHFTITGRAREMLIRGGENIFPREIEDFLYTHPKIADVSVVGLPDRLLGEAVLAWIRLKVGETATEEEIQSFCDGRIAHFKIPRYIRFVDAFPMTVTGKIQKFRIREIEIEDRGLAEVAAIRTA